MSPTSQDTSPSQKHKPRLSNNEACVLSVLVDRYDDWEANCLYFDTIVDETDLERKIVRRMCRLLARKGLAKYERGLFNIDGEVAGSGYRATKEGSAFIKERGGKAND